jgi:hypothetical protein
MDKTDLIFLCLRDNSGMRYFFFLFTSSKEQDIPRSNFSFWDFFTQSTLFCGGSWEFDAYRCKGMVDQSGTVHSCACGASIAVGCAPVGFGRFDKGKFWGRLGYSPFAATAAQYQEYKNKEKKEGIRRKINSFQGNLFWLFQVYPSKE